jgi:FkbM family methyltransferase
MMIGAKSVWWAAPPFRRGRLGRHLVVTETGRRKAFVPDAASFIPYVAVETNGEVRKKGTLFFLPTRQKAGRDLFMKAEWKENRHLKRALDALEQVGLDVAGTMFVDVGAHIGTTTITAVGRFGFESALAFEPELANFRLLRTNIVFKGLETRIQTFNVAVSKRIGNAQLKLRRSMGLKQRLLRADKVAANTVRVPLTTLDALVEDGSLNPADAGPLWLDVEGHELEALQGASRRLERSVPIVMEFIPCELLRDGRLEALRSFLAERYKRGFTGLLFFRLPNPSASPTAL